MKRGTRRAKAYWARIAHERRVNHAYTAIWELTESLVGIKSSFPLLRITIFGSYKIQKTEASSARKNAKPPANLTDCLRAGLIESIAGVSPIHPGAVDRSWEQIYWLLAASAKRRFVVE